MKGLKDILLFLLRTYILIGFIQGIKDKALGNETHNHQGRSFLLGFLEMDTDEGTSTIYVTSSTPSEIHLFVPFLNKTFTKHTIPGISTKIDLSPAVRMRGISAENKGILLTANTTVSVYATNARKRTRDAYVIFPTSTLGTQYVMTTYTPKVKSLAGIIALQDNTLVQIKLRTQGNVSYMGKVYQNGDMLRIFLNRLQTFQLQHTKDLTGTFVVSTGPVVVLGGNIRAEVSNNPRDGSHLCTQLLPVSKWGKQFITSPVAGRDRTIKVDHFKIVAGFRNTVVKIQGKFNVTLNAGQSRNFNLGRKEARYIECSKPVMLMQYNLGSSGYIQSEPFALMVPPIEQYTNSFNLPIPVKEETPPFANHISFVAKTSEFKSIAFNVSKFCRTGLTKLPISQTKFTTYSCQIKKLDVATVIPISHTLQDGRIIAYMVGHTDKDGYGYLGGMEMKDINCMRLFQDGMTMVNGPDGRIDINIANITSCDPKLSVTQIPPSTSEYLNGLDVNHNITTQNCKALVTRIYSFNNGNNGTKTVVAKQQIRWEKRRPTIRLAAFAHFDKSNLSSLEISVRNMSSLCPGDRLEFYHSSSDRKNGTKAIQILWIVREACGRVTTARQRIIVHSNDSVENRMSESSSTLLVVVSTSLGIPVVIMAMVICIILAWRSHVSQTITISTSSVRQIDVKEANDVYINSYTIENRSYQPIAPDANHNSPTEPGKALPHSAT